MKNYYVYVMMHEDNVVNYTGITNNLFRRNWEHKNDINENSFTSRYNIKKLVYFEEYDDPNQAIAREKQIKGMSRQKKIGLIKMQNPEFKDLSDEWADCVIDL